ncbi:2-amino-4-hydroxy-6-hydroxymethyldihydropteridine diphosphokinase [Shimia ponticola]|uniref:2-amino-4-hydroxy-6- hydroxymethyldihydropteridine diphosphokinase n=1 Tax=Shimia ponticola TaxID=2582893 RepID=UPI0011BDEEE0|nr:2-amino-4-hydroxy-6-hydroxymethyldihydropteridine diphosphokinase [Shimia ponticola]
MSQDKKQLPCGQRYILALGGNLPSSVGAPTVTIQHALQSLREYDLRVKKISRFFQTPAFPAGNGPDYVNAAVLIEADEFASQSTDAACRSVLGVLHKVEHAFGRTRDTRWGQRTLDLDLIAAGDTILPDRAGFEAWMHLPMQDQVTRVPDELILPHPRMHERAFVLVPMADVAPEWVHPVAGQSVQQMIAALPQDEVASVVALD